MSPSDRKHPANHAVAFHGLAASFLAVEGFALAEDPAVRGRYGGSQALYRSERRLSLSIGFEPVDGNYACVSFGREWSCKECGLFLSNSYSSMARRFELDVPLSYSMGGGEQHGIVVAQIVADLKRTLPIVVSRVSLNDLLAVENEEPRGATVMAVKSFGADYSASVDVSRFSD